MARRVMQKRRTHLYLHISLLLPLYFPRDFLIPHRFLGNGFDLPGLPLGFDLLVTDRPSHRFLDTAKHFADGA
jgi:hypothetical protein